MGTPAVINFQGIGSYGAASTLSLYQHYDGYPTFVLEALADALQSARLMVTEARAESPHTTCNLIPSTLMGCYIGETTTAHGMAVSVIDDDSHYGEWRYSIDTTNQNIEVTDSETRRKDPRSYIAQLYEEYKAKERAAIERSIKKIAALGYSINE